MRTVAKTGSAFDMLHRDILNGTYAPGQPLRIAALSAVYGVSATPLREALSRLEEKHLVVALANRGWRVAPVSLAEFEDLSLARLAIESALLDDAMSQGGLEWESALVGAHYRLAQTPAPLGSADTLVNRQQWINAHDAFHDALHSAARSGWLKDFHAQITTQLQRHHQAVLFHTAGGQEAAPLPRAPETDEVLRTALSVERHTRLMQPALARDREAAHAELSAHVETTLTIYRTIVGAKHNTTPPTERTDA